MLGCSSNHNNIQPGRLRGIDAGQTLSSSPQRVTARNVLGSRVPNEAGSSAGQYLYQFEGCSVALN
jgi:hypothetical protein